MTKFASLDLIEPIQRALTDVHYIYPTPIQSQAIPPLLEGRDVLGCAQTGTGKTAAFLLPTLQKLSKSKRLGKPMIRALILTPTRELAAQIGDNFECYARYLPLRHLVIFGGVNQNPQVDALKRGVDVLVATPGRLLDLHQQGCIRFEQVEFFVLDEADRMLDMGFIHDVRKILTMLPEKRQNLLFSATMPASIVQLAKGFLNNPITVEVDQQSSTVQSIQQQVMFVEKSNKKRLLLHLLGNKDIESAIVFTRTKHGANLVVKELIKGGVVAAAIHGNKSQNARTNALAGFKEQRIRVLVATDIASRGIDVDGVSHVFNYSLPNISESYVHRIGRTGRAGRSGVAISFCDESEVPYLKAIERLTKETIEVVADHPWHSPAAKSNPKPSTNQPKEPKKVVQRTPNQKNTGKNRNNRSQRFWGSKK